MCNLYSLGRQGPNALRAFLQATCDETGNMPELPAISPNSAAPVVHLREGERTLLMMRWGLPSPASALRPWWLIHDAHVQRTGDLMRPVVLALTAIERELCPGEAGRCERVMRTLRARHDAAIYAAAGLPLPNTAQAAVPKRIDERCLAIEHRDFHRECERPWAHERAGIEAGRGTVRRYLPGCQAEAGI